MLCMLIHHGIGGDDLASMNQCKMYLQAIYLSDICTRDGKAINQQFWDGKEKCHTMPQTECPKQTEWNMWCKYLTKALSLRRWDSLVTPLGNWTWHNRQQDGYFVEQDGDHLVEKRHEHWKIYTKIPSQNQQLKFHPKARDLPEQEVSNNVW